MSVGGEVSFMEAETGGAYYEVHVFNEPGEYTLEFLGAPPPSITAEYLIVAGGGGGGSTGQYQPCGGGGGAGGLVYDTGTLTLEGGTVAVKVGAGGSRGAGSFPGPGDDNKGGDGGYSAIGTITVPGGGGGGQAHGNDKLTGTILDGRPGGSGGGGGSGVANREGGEGQSNTTGGTYSIENLAIQGNPGGTGSRSTNRVFSGGGGGGAGGPGADGLGDKGGGEGGDPWTLDANPDWAWLESVTGATEFARGGNGWAGNDMWNPMPGQNYGDGGSGSTGYTRNHGMSGAAGHSGIVVIRFLYTAP
jgi:hypothetical protein